MKYICDLCGTQLPVDRDIDDDRHFQSVRDNHLAVDCPRAFLDENSGRLNPREAHAAE